MPTPAPDLDKVFAPLGGFELVCTRLLVYAKYEIRRRSSPSPNGRRVAALDARALVNNAVLRLGECESFDDGRAVYHQLRRHIDNEVRGLQKQKSEPELVSLLQAGYEEGARSVAAEPIDTSLKHPTETLEEKEDEEFAEKVFGIFKDRCKTDVIAVKLFEVVIAGMSDRGEISKHLKISLQEYDAVLKRVRREVGKIKMELLKKGQMR